MARVIFSLCFIAFFFVIVCSNFVEGKTWCVAQAQASDSVMQQTLDRLCGQLDCEEIQPGGSCFDPNTLRNHASYAIDLNFWTNGVCDTSYATPSPTDPCKFLIFLFFV
ncbi:putative carbohydrate-binding X8 domain-containing protein, plant [Helianthus annuus]|nr:putative carbohydrate-binding X8 domain-containing protein, plant [Helianthus annuus]